MTHLFPPDFETIDILSQAYLLKNPNDGEFRKYRNRVMNKIELKETVLLDIDEIAWVRHTLDSFNPVTLYKNYAELGGMETLFVFYYLCERFLIYKQDVLKKGPPAEVVKDLAKKLVNNIFDKLEGK